MNILDTNHTPKDLGRIEIRDVDIHFGEGRTAVQALKGISLNVEPGAFVSLLGPSGCGKSTIIGAVAGFTPISSGEVRVDSQRVGAPGPDRGVVFQQHTLFPWKTVFQNVEFGLKMRGAPAEERRRTTRDILARVGLGDFQRHYPSQLSGGMQQRVNLARVLVNRPRVLLMDEPFCSLDAQTRQQMQEMLLELWREYHMTVVFVTHDVDEALFLSDRVLVLTERPGRIKARFEVGLPRPRTLDLLTTPEFMRLKRGAMEALKTGCVRRRESLRQLGLEQGEQPNAQQGSRQGEEGEEFARTDLGVDGPRAGSGDEPSQAEQKTADDGSLVQGLARNGQGFARYGGGMEPLDEEHGQRAHRHRGSDDEIQVRLPEQEHGADLVRRDDLGLGKHNPEIGAEKQEFQVAHARAPIPRP
jgi:NitT/TauT family transport system ATP-binding protein